MNKIFSTTLLLLLFVGNLLGQSGNSTTDLQREVTLYNDYRPSLGVSNKYSFLPSIDDSTTIKQEVVYNINTKAFFPQYSFTPLPAAIVAPEEKPQLYNSYFKVGFGTYMIPLAELSIANTESEKWGYGIYFSHFSSWGNIKLDNNQNVFAGYMDNDAKIYGKRLFKKSVLEGSIDYSQMWRHSYGVYTAGVAVKEPTSKEIRYPFQNIGATLKYSSANVDQSALSYSAELYYSLFEADNDLRQSSYGLVGGINKNVNGFNFGFNLEIDIDNCPNIVTAKDKYLLNVKPYFRKQFKKWGVRAGASVVYASSDNPNDNKTDLYLFPDAEIDVKIWASYIELFAKAGGTLKHNDPRNVVTTMPFLTNDDLFGIKNTLYKHNLMAGFKGLTGIGGHYLISASLSEVENMPFFDNVVFAPLIYSLIDNSVVIYPPMARGRLFETVYDNLKLFTLHGEIDGQIIKGLSYRAAANYYRYYEMTNFEYPIGKPDWDFAFELSYNYREKIFVDMGFKSIGERKFGYSSILSSEPYSPITYPEYAALNIKATYSYSNRISFWVKADNISFGRTYYEYPFYPVHSNVILGGVTFSL